MDYSNNVKHAMDTSNASTDIGVRYGVPGMSLPWGDTIPVEPHLDPTITGYHIPYPVDLEAWYGGYIGLLRPSPTPWCDFYDRLARWDYTFPPKPGLWRRLWRWVARRYHRPATKPFLRPGVTYE